MELTPLMTSDPHLDACLVEILLLMWTFLYIYSARRIGWWPTSLFLLLGAALRIILEVFVILYKKQRWPYLFKSFY